MTGIWGADKHCVHLGRTGSSIPARITVPSPDYVGKALSHGSSAPARIPASVAWPRVGRNQEFQSESWVRRKSCSVAESLRQCINLKLKESTENQELFLGHRAH